MAGASECPLPTGRGAVLRRPPGAHSPGCRPYPLTGHVALSPGPLGGLALGWVTLASRWTVKLGLMWRAPPHTSFHR